MRSHEKPILLYFIVAVFVVAASYYSFFQIAMHSRPLDTQMAYDAMVSRLKQTQAGQHPLDLSETTVVERDNELIFYGRGQFHSADRRQEVPVLRNYDFRYLGVVIRKNCKDGFPNCYLAEEVEIYGQNVARPMI